jgi:hypothetical protein
LFNAKSANFSSIPWRDQSTCLRDDDDDVPFAIDQHTYSDLYIIISLKQQSVSKNVDPLDTFS